MKLIIHKGTDEIGGTCIQLSTDSTTILLDVGAPLKDDSGYVDYSKIEPDAIIISHPHQDHYGLMGEFDHDIPIYMGKTGKELIDATAMFLGREVHHNAIIPIVRDRPFVIGDMEITPYLMDHSAVDAFAFLIESKDTRIFYTGDFRAHGRKSVLFDRITEDPPKDIHILLMEGTMIARDNDEFPDEASVEKKIDEVIRDQNNISFVISSSQNIDRIVSIYRSCLKNDKKLIIDLYTAWVLEQIKQISHSVPNMEWDDVKVYADYRHDQRLKENLSKTGDFRSRAYEHRIRKEEIQAEPSKYVYLSRMSKFSIMDLYKSEERPVNVIYSQWIGYLEKDGYGSHEISAYREDPHVNFVYAHTSGHATMEDLKTFCSALAPKIVIPIHTEFKEEYENLFGDVLVLDDGEEFFYDGEKMDDKVKRFVRYVEENKGKQRNYPACMNYDIHGRNAVIELRSDFSKKAFRRFDSWSLAFISEAEEKLGVDIDKVTFKIDHDMADCRYDFESFKRRVSFLEMNNNIGFKIILNGEDVELYDEHALFNRPEHEVVRTEITPRGDQDKGHLLEKAFQAFLYGKDLGKPTRTNDRMAILGKEFYKAKSKDHGVLREFPTGVFRENIAESCRLMPTESVDIVTINKYGNLSVIELKIDDEQLEVISQILDYALFFRCYRDQLLKVPMVADTLGDDIRKDDIHCYVVNNHFHPRFNNIMKYYSTKNRDYGFKLVKIVLGYTKQF